jgi:hypothetical protein
MSNGPVKHDPRSPELLATMEQRHLARKSGQEESFFHRRIAAADHRDLLAGEEEAVAGRARANTVPYQCLLRRQTKPAGRRSAGNDQCPRMNGLVAKVQRERMLGQIRGRQVPEPKLGAKARSLLAHVLDQIRSLNALRPARKVLDQSRDRQLAARLVTFEQEWFQIGASRVDRCCQSGAAGAKDDCVAYVFCHLRELSNCTCDLDQNPSPAAGLSPAPELEPHEPAVPD